MKWGKVIAYLLALMIVMSIGIVWENYRYQTFKEVTKSDIGYWKWKFVFDNKSK